MKTSNSQKRLKEMMEVLDIKQIDIVKKTGIQKSSLSNYINGRRTPTQEQLSLIADPYNINPAWLMGYDVPMKAEELSIEKKIANLPLNPSEIEEAMRFYNQYKNLTPEDQAAIQTLLRSLRPEP